MWYTSTELFKGNFKIYLNMICTKIAYLNKNGLHEIKYYQRGY